MPTFGIVPPADSVSAGNFPSHGVSPNYANSQTKEELINGVFPPSLESFKLIVNVAGGLFSTPSPNSYISNRASRHWQQRTTSPHPTTEKDVKELYSQGLEEAVRHDNSLEHQQLYLIPQQHQKLYLIPQQIQHQTQQNKSKYSFSLASNLSNHRSIQDNLMSSVNHTKYDYHEITGNELHVFHMITGNIQDPLTNYAYELLIANMNSLNEYYLNNGDVTLKEHVSRLRRDADYHDSVQLTELLATPIGSVTSFLPSSATYSRSSPTLEKVNPFSVPAVTNVSDHGGWTFHKPRQTHKTRTRTKKKYKKRNRIYADDGTILNNNIPSWHNSTTYEGHQAEPVGISEGDTSSLRSATYTKQLARYGKCFSCS